MRDGILAQDFCARSASLDGGLDVGGVTLGGVADGLAGGRVDDVEGLAERPGTKRPSMKCRPDRALASAFSSIVGFGWRAMR